MSIEEITEHGLLRNSRIKSVDFENENYFSINDMNDFFMGSFRNISTVPLPIMYSNGKRDLTSCISWKNINERIEQLKGKSDFEKRINTALNFNTNKK